MEWIMLALFAIVGAMVGSESGFVIGAGFGYLFGAVWSLMIRISRLERAAKNQTTPDTALPESATNSAPSEIKTTTEATTLPCEQCRIGHCRPTTAPYIYWIKRQVLVLPNAPAYSCDSCGQLQYDAGFLMTLEMLLQELEFSSLAEKPAKHPIQTDLAPQWHPSRSR